MTNCAEVYTGSARVEFKGTYAYVSVKIVSGDVKPEIKTVADLPEDGSMDGPEAIALSGMCYAIST